MCYDRPLSSCPSSPFQHLTSKKIDFSQVPSSLFLQGRLRPQETDDPFDFCRVGFTDPSNSHRIIGSFRSSKRRTSIRSARKKRNIKGIRNISCCTSLPPEILLWIDPTSNWYNQYMLSSGWIQGVYIKKRKNSSWSQLNLHLSQEIQPNSEARAIKLPTVKNQIEFSVIFCCIPTEHYTTTTFKRGNGNIPVRSFGK